MVAQTFDVAIAEQLDDFERAAQAHKTAQAAREFLAEAPARRRFNREKYLTELRPLELDIKMIKKLQRTPGQEEWRKKEVEFRSQLWKLQCRATDLYHLRAASRGKYHLGGDPAVLGPPEHARLEEFWL